MSFLNSQSKPGLRPAISEVVKQGKNDRKGPKNLPFAVLTHLVPAFRPQPSHPSPLPPYSLPGDLVSSIYAFVRFEIHIPMFARIFGFLSVL